MSTNDLASKPFRILSLDGGGAKGFYTLGVLREVEMMLKCPIYEAFDLIFGTSTGAIIAALLALGKSVDDVYALYKQHVPSVMKPLVPSSKSLALNTLASEVFGDATFLDVRTSVGLVATKWVIERPMIFKGDAKQAHGRVDSFSPGFGCTVSDAVQASCSAYPFFKRKIVVTDKDDHIELVDGGYSANNPTLYAIADAIGPMQIPIEAIRVLSIGVGEYPRPKHHPLKPRWWLDLLPSVRLLQKTLEINTQSMDQLRAVLFNHIRTVRVNENFNQPTMATDLLEHDLDKLNILRQRGGESYAKRDAEIRDLLLR